MNTIAFNMPEMAYRAAEGVNFSALKHIEQSPLHARNRMLNPPQPTEAQMFGRIIHAITLTPKAPPFWVVKPEGLDGRSKEGKEWKAAAGDAYVVDSKDWKRFEEIRDALVNHPSGALKSGEPEVSVFADFTLGTTIQRKARLDFVSDGDSIVDIKTTNDASPDGMRRFIAQWKTYVQGAYYMDCWNSVAEITGDYLKRHYFCIVAVEKEPPYGIGVYYLSQATLQQGRGEYIGMLQRWMECVETNEWPGYSTSPVEIELPAWATKQPMSV